MTSKSKALLINLLLITCGLSGCMGGENQEETQGSLVIAFEVQADYENIDENPQILADYLSEKMNYDVTLYSVCLLYTSPSPRDRG